MAQQTAVDWLERRVEERKNNNIMETAYWHLKEFIKDFEQAKQMEKGQIEKAWGDGFDTGYLSPNNAEKYYNETYGK